MKRSSLAEPPIAPHECDELNVAICRYHGGRIGFSPAEGDTYGKVFYCPVGLMWWRYTKGQSGMHTPLNFPKGM